LLDSSFVRHKKPVQTDKTPHWQLIVFVTALNTSFQLGVKLSVSV